VKKHGIIPLWVATTVITVSDHAGTRMNRLRTKGTSLQNTAHMHSTTRFPLVALALALVFTACKKDDPEPPATPGGGGGSSTPSTAPFFSDADGLVSAIRVLTTQSTPIGPVDLVLGIATGVFSNDAFATFQNVGAVSCNGEALTRQSNNNYTYQPSATNPTGIDLTASNEVTWNVGGGSGFAAFDRTIPGPFPVAGSISSATTVVRANGYTITTGSVLNADSVVFTLGSLVRTIPGNATSCTFTAAELSGLSTGSSLVQVAPYNSTSEVIGGKRIYFVKQYSRSLSVTIQ